MEDGEKYSLLLTHKEVDVIFSTYYLVIEGNLCCINIFIKLFPRSRRWTIGKIVRQCKYVCQVELHGSKSRSTCRSIYRLMVNVKKKKSCQNQDEGCAIYNSQCCKSNAIKMRCKKLRQEEQRINEKVLKFASNLINFQRFKQKFE